MRRDGDTTGQTTVNWAAAGSGVDAADNDDFATVLYEVTIGGDTELRAARIRVTDDYSVSEPNSVAITGSVGASGDNFDIDEYRVQQRLRYLNFRGEGHAEVVVDGAATHLTQANSLIV